MLKKTVLVTAIGVSLGAVSMQSQAALVSGTLLTLEPWNGDAATSSSFLMGTARTGLNPGADGGVIIGVAQPGGGSHGGPPNGSETAPIDAPWLFFSNTGLHFTTAPITVIDNDVNNDGGFTQTLDFAGWAVSWNGIPQIPLPGVATINCSLADCAAGSDYSLDYAISIPPSPLHGFGGVAYRLELRGSVVPVPAAVWLFGSGLLGLVGLARHRKQEQS